MKLINYKYGYLFNCSIHGKIKMTPEELEQVVKYLRHNKVQHTYFAKTGFTQAIFENDLKRTMPIKGGYLINIRVGATELLVKKFGLKGYKRGNYMLEIDMRPITKRLKYLRQELRAERMSYGELAELQSLAKYIEAGDVELLEAAGVPEFK